MPGLTVARREEYIRSTDDVGPDPHRHPADSAHGGRTGDQFPARSARSGFLRASVDEAMAAGNLERDLAGAYRGQCVSGRRSAHRIFFDESLAQSGTDRTRPGIRAESRNTGAAA